MPTINPAVYPVLGNTADSLIGNVMTMIQNKKNRQYAEKQYARERADSLADWNMNNAYNAPAAVMARLKEAGLNPNLVYGNGGSIMQAATVRDSDLGTYQQTPLPGTQLGQSMGEYYNTKLIQAQTDNVKAATEVQLQEKNLKIIQAFKTLFEGKTTQFDLDRKEELKRIIFEQGAANLDLTKANIDATVHANQRANELQSRHKQLMDKQLTQADLEAAGKRLENDLQKAQNGQFNQMSPLQLAQLKAEIEHIEQKIKESKQHAANEKEQTRINKMEADAGRLVSIIKSLMGGKK